MKDSFVDSLSEQFLNYVVDNNIDDFAACAKLQRQLSDSISEKILQKLNPELEQIASENAVIEVIDKETGNLFRRYLELEYTENDNGLMLFGENLSGSRSQIVFLSESAILKLKDLKGAGADSPRCQD